MSWRGVGEHELEGKQRDEIYPKPSFKVVVGDELQIGNDLLRLRIFVRLYECDEKVEPENELYTDIDDLNYLIASGLLVQIKSK